MQDYYSRYLLQEKPNDSGADKKAIVFGVVALVVIGLFMIIVSWLLSRRFHKDMEAAYLHSAATATKPYIQLYHPYNNKNNNNTSDLTMWDTLNASIAVTQPDNSLSLGVIMECPEDEEQAVVEDNTNITKKRDQGMNES